MTAQCKDCGDSGLVELCYSDLPAFCDCSTGHKLLKASLEPTCAHCDGAGYIEVCYGNNPDDEARETCPECGGWTPEEGGRQRGDDDGAEYGDPRDEMEDRMTQK